MSVSTLIFVSLIFILLYYSLVRKLFFVLNPPNLKNKHVFITGGSSGTGKATAIEAAKLGAHVTIVARDKTKLENSVVEIKKSALYGEKQQIQCLAVDVTEGLAAVGEAVETVESSIGPVFLLVNCAGMCVCGEFETATEAEYRYMMELNYFGTVFPSLCLAKRMKKRKEGHVVIVGSQASLVGVYGMSAYSASKFALRGFAESLFMELKPHNVSVTLCIPPDTNTPGFALEENSRPKVTKMIWKTSELFDPSDVARRLLSHALSGRFTSAIGAEGLLLSALCAGMSPVTSVTDFLLQVFSMGVLRLVSFGYHLHFQTIIRARANSSAERKDLTKTN